jgi:uncharacterized FAD-dependent dehydrogenase
MGLLLRDVVLQLHQDESDLPRIAAGLLRLRAEDLKAFRVIRRAVDARHKPRVKRIYTVSFSTADESGLLQTYPQILQPVSQPESPVAARIARSHHALVVGMGPAGLFAALRLASCGVRVTLVERGGAIERRVDAVRRFWETGLLNPESNVQFGEGGAGTFSDGKLTTRVNHRWTRYILETLVACGAPESILIEARPHVGTDRLRSTLIRFRDKLLALGVAIRFDTKLTTLQVAGSRIRGAVLNEQDELPVDSLVLAPGHSARDTYAMLQECGVALEAKPFAVGLRIEHPVELINLIQYGFPDHPKLPTADYKLAWNDPVSGRGIFSFCMCPGGEVILSSSEPDAVVVNGMSLYQRNSPYSNSALVVSVGPDDFPGAGPLAGIAFQRQLEQQAYQAGGGGYYAPAQNLLDFLQRGNGPVRASCRPGVREADLNLVLPQTLADVLRQALPGFERKMPGFITREAVLIGVESRTSAPLRILRGDNGESLTHAGLYPAGEGAGYAGGIMSAALDGLRAAENLLHNHV